MIDRLKRFLVWVRLVDAHDRVVSLTSVALYIVLWKLLRAEKYSLPDLTALMGCLGLYHLKRRTSATIQAGTEGDVSQAKKDAAAALAGVALARDELKTHTDKLRLMLDTVAMGRR